MKSNSEIIISKVNDSSKRTAGYFILFILIGAYIGIATAQTTDLDLLLENPVILPLVQTAIPLVHFYTLAVIIVFTLHIILIYNLSMHHQRLILLKNKTKNSLSKIYINLFIFDQMILNDKLNPFLRWFGVIALFYSLPLLLLIITWRFTDYQSVSISIFHGLLTLASTFFSIKIVKKFLKKNFVVFLLHCHFIFDTYFCTFFFSFSR